MAQCNAAEVSETLAKVDSEDFGDSRILDELPPETPRVAPATLTPKSDDFGLSWVQQKQTETESTSKDMKGHKNTHVTHDEDDDDVAPPVGFFESDAFQRIVVTINVLIAIYSAVMAALLAIFVPQHCCPKEAIDDWGTCRNATTGEEDVSQILKICTIADNVDFENNTSYNNYVLIFNFITLSGILAVFIIEYWRENFLITCLDIDKHNSVYFWAYIVVFALWICNAVSSAVLVFRFYYLDTRTATVFLTNNLLLLTRFIKGYGVTFNAVDKDYKKKYLPGGGKFVAPPASPDAAAPVATA